MSVEMTVTATDEAPIQPLRDRARFRLQFALLMLASDRLEEAAAAFEHLDQLIDMIDT